MPLASPWRTAYGEDSTVESVLVRMQSGQDVGWGESAPTAAPTYSPEWTGGVFAVVRDVLAPAVIGRDVTSGDELQELLARFKGNPFGKAALDTAWWVLEAVRRKEPLHRVLGGKRDSIRVGADFGVMDSIGQLIEAVGGAVEAGFPRTKLKFRPGWGVEMLRAVRSEFPQTTIHVDCNSAYTLEATDLFCRLDDFFLAMIEQPLSGDDLIDHARLAQLIRTPICLDESITSVARTEQALDLGSCRYVNIKPGRVGGLTPAVKIHDLCQKAGVPCWVGGMLESAVGARVCLALGTLDNFTYPADVFPSSRFYWEDLADPPLVLDRGADGVPEARASLSPGIGAEPNPARLAALCRAHARIGDRDSGGVGRGA
jgi:O-succinylbenzoate synthase